jgi:hypothetical protein
MRLVGGCILFAATIASVFLTTHPEVRAQMYQCPPPSVMVGGGGGEMCQCPDGSYASIYGCPSSGPSYQQPQPEVGDHCPNGNTCPVGYYCSRIADACTPNGKVDCGDYNCEPGQHCASGHRACLSPTDVDCGHYSCSGGNKCSSAGCIPHDAKDCGNKSYCGASLKCSRDRKHCFPENSTDCGSYSCDTGKKCSSAGCIAQNAVDCGNKTSCQAGSKCSRDHKHCFPQDSVDCGSFSCNAGMKCSSGNRCLAKTDVDCGGGQSCTAGNKCSKGGGCVPSAAVDCGHGVSCPTGNHCGSGNQCLAKGDVDCGNGTSCGQGEKCVTRGTCIPKNATACGSSYCNSGFTCVDGKNCLTKAQIAQQAKAAAELKQQQQAADVAKKTSSPIGQPAQIDTAAPAGTPASTLDVSPQVKNTIQTLSASGRLNLANATSSNGYIYPRTLASKPAKQQEQCVELVTATTNLGPASNWRASSTSISPYVAGNHPDIASGTPIATFESNGKYPAATGDMGTPRLDGKTSNTSSHAAIFVDYIKDPQGNVIGMQILSQSEHHPTSVEDKYFITNTHTDLTRDTVGYGYSVIQQ